MKLTDILCRNAKSTDKPRKISDGRGLFLLVQPTGGKLWRYSYRHLGKQKTLALGAYPSVGLKDARSSTENARELLSKGIDPGEQKKTDRRKSEQSAANTFELVAREWFNARLPGWTVGYSDRIMRRIEQDVFPHIGDRPLGSIEPPELLDLVRRVEDRNAIVLAKRIMQVCGQIFRYGVASGRCSRDPTQDLRGALRTPQQQVHRASLKAGELPGFLFALRNYDGDRFTVIGLRVVLHTFLRTAEVRYARWSEIEGLDGPTPIWRIPAARMKMRSEHLVPLTPQVVALLNALKKDSHRSPYLFPAPTKEGVISQNTLIFALYRMGYHSRATVHGFRSTASTILNEQGFNRDWIERQLAHVERNDVRAAYNSAEWLTDRRLMLTWWSDYLTDIERAIPG